jgi:hypothetical protein
MRLYVTPFPGTAEWVPITSGSAYDGPGHWSPDSNRIYFLSNRDGFSCLWEQRLDSLKRPIGEPSPVRHFHSAARYAYLYFSVSRNYIVLTIQERTGNIWLAK